MDAQDFEHIYSSTKAKIAAIARNFGKAESFDLDEQDVVQEAMVALWELASKGYPIRNPEALLVKIAKNICVGRLRTQKIKSSRIGPESLAVPAQELDSDWPDENEIRQMYFECLTKTELECFILRADDGMTINDISQTTGKSKEGIKMALSRARKKLKQRIKGGNQ